MEKSFTTAQKEAYTNGLRQGLHDYKTVMQPLIKTRIKQAAATAYVLGFIDAQHSRKL